MKFALKITTKSAFFNNCFLVKFALKTPMKFPRNRPIFLRIFPKNPAKFDFVFHNLSEALLHVAFIPGCMLMLKVGKDSPGVLNFIQQKFQFEISLIPHAQHFNFNNSTFCCTDSTQATACYCSCKQDIQKSGTGDNNFVKWRGTFQFNRPK